MKPSAYVEVELPFADANGGVSPLVLRGEAFMHLHRAFASTPGLYALAIPKGRVDRLRIFASNPEDLDALAERLGGNRWFRDYARLTCPSAVDPDQAAPRVAFARWRIPTVKSDRHASNGVSELRDRRLRLARDQRLDHFRVRSASTGANFSLTVERIVSSDLPWGGTPNGYGLCSRHAPLGLPDLP